MQVDNDSTATASCSFSSSATLTCSSAEQENIYSDNNVDDVSFEQQNLEVYSKKCYTLYLHICRIQNLVAVNVQVPPVKMYHRLLQR